MRNGIKLKLKKLFEKLFIKVVQRKLLYIIVRSGVFLRKCLFLATRPKWEETIEKEEADVENLFAVH